MTDKVNTKRRKGLLDILLDNAEEPDDIKDGFGTFVTYRVEYVLNELEAYIDKAVEKARIAGAEELYNQMYERYGGVRVDNILLEELQKMKNKK